MKKTWVLIFLVCFVFVKIPCAFAQIKTDWIDKDKEKRQVDYQAKKLQIGLEISGGMAKFTEKWVEEYEFDDPMYDASFVFGYRLLRSSSMEKFHIEMLLLGSIGMNNLEFNHWRLMGSAGIEVGGHLAVGSSWGVRPFASFSPAISISDDIFGIGDQTAIVWIPRVGVEIQNNNSPISFLIGGKMIIRSSKELEESWRGPSGEIAKLEETDYLGFISIRVKV